MGKLIYSLGITITGLIFGQIIQALTNTRLSRHSVPINKVIRLAQQITLLILNPIINFGAFWIIGLKDTRLISVPVLGVCALILGGIIASIYSRLFKHNNFQKGAMFTSGSFTNMGTFGGLVCFTFFGESSYAFVSMYKLLEEVAYFMIGYPIAKFYSVAKTGQREKSPLIRIITDPYVIIYFLSIAIGVGLNLSGIPRPNAYKSINDVLIPLSTLMLVTSVGFRMQVNAIRAYLRECYAVASIKFLISPIVITTAAWLLGLGEPYNGLVLKVILIESCMPPAFNSLIPPQIYGLDVDLSNSCWLFCTGALVVVLPVLYLLQSLF